MHNGGKIAIDGGIGNGQRRHNGRHNGEAIATGDGIAAAQWTAQWVADDCHQRRSGAIGGNARWTAATITMDGDGKIAVVGGSGDGQLRRND
jgi:hypothetical protein